MNTVRREPDIISITALLVVSFHDPHVVVKDRNLVVLPRVPRGGFRVLLPMDTVRRTPDIVVEIARRRLWRVVRTPTENPDPILEDHIAADHASW